MGSGIGFLMDAVILALLGATVFLAYRLNTNLRNFKQSRSEMEGVVNRLTANIERAEKAVAGLQVSARNSGMDMDKKIKESKFLIDELKFMNEAGDSLASRLEKLAETNRALIEKIEASGGVGPGSSTPPQMQSDIRVNTLPDHAMMEPPSSGFAIQDRDMAMQSDDDDLDFLFEEESVPLQSQAEREFFQALQSRSRKGVGRG